MVKVEQINEFEYEVDHRIKTSRRSGFNHKASIKLSDKGLVYKGDVLKNIIFKGYKPNFAVNYSDIVYLNRGKSVITSKILYYMLNGTMLLMSTLGLFITLFVNIYFMIFIIWFDMLWILSLCFLSFPVLVIETKSDDIYVIPFNIDKDKSDFLQEIYQKMSLKL